MSSLDYLDLCRLCLVKDRVSVPIFEGEGDVRQIFLKIAACLPVKVAREDKLPKKICDDCVYKVELFYQFWNTTANAEKQLLQWLGEVDIEDNVSGVLNTDVMKQEQSGENRLDGTVMQQVSSHQNNMGIGIMDNMGLGMPIIMSSNNQQQITSVPMDTSGSSVQLVQAVPGPSSQTSQDQANTSRHQDEEEDESEEEDNSDDECDGDQGLPVKEESEDDPGTSGRTLEPTTFVNVSVPCDEAGPSGLQQQKIVEMPEIAIPQTTDGDPKSGVHAGDPLAHLVVIKEEDTDHQWNEATGEFDARIKEESNEGVIWNEKGKEKTKQILKSMIKANVSENVMKVRGGNSSKKPSICEICNRAFDCSSRLKRHMVKHSTSRPFKCPICLRNYKAEAYLRRHILSHKKTSTYYCDSCDFKTQNKPSLRLHRLRIHDSSHNYTCEECGKNFKMKCDYTGHMKHHEKEPCICDVCGGTYPNRRSLYSHKNSKHKAKNKEFKCSKCRCSCVTQENLNKHMKLHKIKYICDHCGIKLKSKYGLTKHLLTHSDEKRYTCEVCGKGFATDGSKKIHQLTHIGERPYVCDICGKTFTQRSPMMLHKRKQHPGKHEAPPPIKIVHLLHNVQGVSKNLAQT